MSGKGFGFDQPYKYRIRVQGRIGPWGADWFDAALTLQPGQLGDQPITDLYGIVADQAALLGLLMKLYQLRMPLLEVRWVGPADGVYPLDGGQTTLIE